MKTLDRYIVRQFLTNYVLLLVSLLLLVITLDLIVNIDEFLDVAERMEDATAAARLKAVVLAIGDFYGPQAFLFYIYGAGILPIGAAGFTFVGLIRNRELVAMLAGGLSLYRLALPILLATSALSTLTLVDHELVIPALREKLIRDHRHMKHGAMKSFSVEFAPDRHDADGDGRVDIDALYTAAEFDPYDLRMSGVTILTRDGRGLARARITADGARWRAERGGWVLSNGRVVVRRDRDELVDGVRPDAAPRPIEFVPSGLDPRSLLLRRNARFKQLLSLREIGQLIDRASGVDVDELRRIRHGRFSLVVVNVLVLAMALPFFMLRTPVALTMPTLKALMVGGGAWAGGYLMIQGGAAVLPPALSAWLPALIYLPAALFLMDTVES